MPADVGMDHALHVRAGHVNCRVDHEASGIHPSITKCLINNVAVLVDTHQVTCAHSIEDHPVLVIRK
jgi:hypothetical protein